MTAHYLNWIYKILLDRRLTQVASYPKMPLSTKISYLCFQVLKNLIFVFMDTFYGSN